MAVGGIEIQRTPMIQPDISDTSKSQKRRAIDDDSSPQLINNELDYLHERINNIVIEAPALTDLAADAALPEVIARVNELTQTLRASALLKQS